MAEKRGGYSGEMVLKNRAFLPQKRGLGDEGYICKYFMNNM